MFLATLLALTSLVFSTGTSFNKPIQKLADTNITNTYDPNFDLMGDYIVNAYINNLDVLEKYASSNIAPANAICYINKDGYMTDKDGNSFNELYSDVYQWYLKGKMIPVFYISDEESADSLINFYNSNQRYDMGVMSSDSSLLLKVKESCTPLHAILDYSYKNDDELVLKDIVSISNICGASTVVLSNSYATRENIFYIQARFKTVWVNDSNATDLEIITQIIDGAYASIVDDVEHTIELIKDFTSKSVNKKFNYNRPIMNVAHRGLPQTSWENSLEGCIEAYNKGATHFEIDIQVTKDRKLAIMHDDTIDRTTNGSGHISDYTEEELKQLRIDSSISRQLQGDGVSIPMLDEIFDYFKGKDIVIIVEIKTSDIYCVSILKEYLEAADIKDQVVVISFYSAQLLRMRQTLPEIPIADLNNYSEANLINSFDMIGKYGMSIDPNYGTYSTSLAHKLAERGLASWFWTFENNQSLFDAIKKGVYGATNNMADYVGTLPTKLSVEPTLNITAESYEDITIEVPYLDYKNHESEEQLSATPIYISENKDSNSAIIIFQAKYSSGNSTPKLNLVLFSAPVTVNLTKPAPTNSGGSNSCGGSISSTSIILSSISFGLITLVIIKRRREN